MFDIKRKCAHTPKQDRSAKKTASKITYKPPSRSNKLDDRCENAKRRKQNVRS
jgi:hypothetical protein